MNNVEMGLTAAVVFLFFANSVIVGMIVSNINHIASLRVSEEDHEGKLRRHIHQIIGLEEQLGHGWHFQGQKADLLNRIANLEKKQQQTKKTPPKKGGK